MADVTLQLLETSRTICINKLKELKNVAEKADISDLNKLAFKVRYEHIQLIHDEFHSLQAQIINKLLETNDLDLTEQEKIRLNFDNTYYQIKGIFTSIFEVYVLNQSIGLDANSSTQDVKPDLMVGARLPKLDLPKFDGNLKMWISFRDIFNSLIHNKTNISNIDKFQYLISSLGQTPLSIIKSVPLSDDNYPQAYNKLMDEYNNKRKIATAYWEQLHHFPKCNHENTTGLKTLINCFDENIEALKLLKFPTESWDFPLFNLLLSKIDAETRKAFEFEMKSIEMPTYKQLRDFLNEYKNVLDHAGTKGRAVSMHQNKGQKQQYSLVSQSNNTMQCYYCGQAHSIYKCNTLLKFSPQERTREIQNLNLCVNCLRPGHVANECKSSKCRECKGQHNTLLHWRKYNNVSQGQTAINMPAQNEPNVRVETNNANLQPLEEGVSRQSLSFTTQISDGTRKITSYSPDITLLSTAIILVYDNRGRPHRCRVLLDSGSQSNFITQAFSEKLNLHTFNFPITISGIEQKISKVQKAVKATIQSQCTSFEVQLQFLILPKITNNMPIVSFNTKDLNIPPTISLADPEFNKAQPIDMLLGAGIFYQLLKNGRIECGSNKPLLQETKLGWVLSGTFPLNSDNKFQPQSICSLSLNEQLLKFWELEEPSVPTRHFTREEEYCEQFFKQTTTRTECGRFIVRLPFKENVKNLGDSYQVALKRQQSVEARFAKNENLRTSYVTFMNEYEALNHMQVSDLNIEPLYYLPHHAVHNKQKIRVVFDATCKPNNGLSLNECLCVGPTIQDELINIILRFRMHRYVIKADIKKMYRQVLIHNDDQKYQNILWRPTSNQPMQTFTLKTVTYGTACAPFLAIRCLREIADQNVKKYPNTCAALKNDFYVDDLLTGASTRDQVVSIKNELTGLLDSYGFELCEWTSNDNTITTNFSDNPLKDLFRNYYDEISTVKTLGLYWNPQSDSIQFMFQCPDQASLTSSINKRQVLSAISKIFDPLGLIGPVVVKAKVFMQNLWHLKLNWDDPLPEDCVKFWHDYLHNIKNISSISIPRYIMTNDTQIVELHAFSDASESAYGCCIYLRSKSEQSPFFQVNLICAKSKVAPLKKRSLPQLELCAATALAHLVSRVKTALRTKINKVYYWCDSKIVLAWISIEPCFLKTFVANRIVQITELTNASDWHHIPSNDNPADIISRGLSPSELATSLLWWNGPQFLREAFPMSNLNPVEEINDIPDVKGTAFSLLVSDDYSLFHRFSSYSRLINVVARIKRWIFNHRNKSQKIVGSLTVEEKTQASYTLIRLAQQQEFKNEILLLGKGKPLPVSSPLSSLTPFLDTASLLRVGGRLQDSDLPYDQVHPIILPTRHRMTELLIKFVHYRNLHAGIQTLASIIRLQYWPVSAKRAIKKALRRCILCFKTKPVAINQLMGNLPRPRITIQRPFSISGVDYAGPFFIKDGVTKRTKTVKCYVCLFVCFVTKAIDLELVKDMTTEAFLGALQRFVSRRGKLSEIHSDNGTNFVGASRDLKSVYDFINKEIDWNKITNFLSSDNITWHFIPPRTPHMGGLWESNVKSVKSYLVKITGSALLTFEQFYTILVQVEACVNSRPLTPISTDPNDYTPLTPGHFLIGDSLAALPQRNYQPFKENRLKQYQRQQQLLQRFWQRWSTEYLATLQSRTKWRFDQPDQLKPDELVVVREDNVPPLKWPMARIIEVHPGKDNKVRVVTVKFSNGTIVKRAVNRICLLPLNDDPNQDDENSVAA